MLEIAPNEKIKNNDKPLNFFDIFRKYHNPQLSPFIYQIKSLFLIGITTQKTEVFICPHFCHLASCKYAEFIRKDTI